MRFTEQEEIGLRCMLQMARNHPQGLVKIDHIAERESLTPAYVAKMMRILRIAGLVESLRGHRGGYQLTREPDDIYLSEILDALGNRFHTPKDCNRNMRKRGRCVHQKDCSIRPLWSGIDQIIYSLLSKCKLSQLMGDEKKMNKWVRTHFKMPPSVFK